MFGSQHNDPFALGGDGAVTTLTNRAGGVLGGMTSGRPVDFRVAFKPTATIAKEQDTVSRDLKPAKVVGRGRHDPCVLPARRSDSGGDGRLGRGGRASSEPLGAHLKF